MYKKGFLAKDSSLERTDLFFLHDRPLHWIPAQPASAISHGFAYAARLGHAQSRRCQKILAMIKIVGRPTPSIGRSPLSKPKEHCHAKLEREDHFPCPAHGTGI